MIFYFDTIAEIEVRKKFLKKGENKMEIRKKVEEALNGIRPHLQADGGDVELVDVTADGVAKVKLIGACGGCPMAAMTLQHGVTKAIKDNVAEIKEVQSV
jgi:Fe-S cluster biogenesis protein NfuA